MGNNILRENNILIYSLRADNGRKDVAVMAETGRNRPKWAEKGRKWPLTLVFLHIIFRGSIKLRGIFSWSYERTYFVEVLNAANHAFRRSKKLNNYMFYVRYSFYLGFILSWS